MSRTVYTPPSIIGTKGDLWGFSTKDAPLPVGANDTVPTADSTQALGLAYKALSLAGAKIWWGVIHMNAGAIASVDTFLDEFTFPHGWQKGTAGNLFSNCGVTDVARIAILAPHNSYIATPGSGNGLYQTFRETFTGSSTFQIVFSYGLASIVGGILTYVPSDDVSTFDMPFFLVWKPT
jgi:hypothetical protein